MSSFRVERDIYLLLLSTIYLIVPFFVNLIRAETLSLSQSRQKRSKGDRSKE